MDAYADNMSSASASEDLTNNLAVTEFEEHKYYLNDSMLRTLGAAGISMKREVEKNEMRRRASEFDGTSATFSFVLRSR